MSDTNIILYDLSSKRTTPSTCWSPNVWKSRLILNYKALPYDTQWVKHDEIESTLSAIGIPANDMSLPSAKAAYTVPAIRLVDGRGIMDSAVIAAELEK